MVREQEIRKYEKNTFKQTIKKSNTKCVTSRLFSFRSSAHRVQGYPHHRAVGRRSRGRPVGSQDRGADRQHGEAVGQLHPQGGGGCVRTLCHHLLSQGR